MKSLGYWGGLVGRFCITSTMNIPFNNTFLSLSTMVRTMTQLAISSFYTTLYLVFLLAKM